MAPNPNVNGVAIIGLSGRFPGASNVLEFWQNLVNGVDSISDFSDEQLAAAGLPVVQLRQDSNWVTARGVLNRAEWFDASFFNIGAKEAEVTDPQQRIFLEAAWEALEDAGYDPARVKGYVGVYAGSGSNYYYLSNLHPQTDLINLVGKVTIGLGNEKDFLATRVAYKLNLKGPALSINTACSTSLVAVCQACQALLCYQCDLALAGGVSVRFPQIRPNYHQEGGALSPDGRTRPFDVNAAGTSFSDGLGVVVLKRVAEAIRDGDQIYAVIKGFGVNNDGSAKVGFTAPSVEGQAEVVALAMGQAGFDSDSISYIEAHGTATPLGDPIEIAALTKAFRMDTTRNGFCAIGSLKGNIGHADAAAGVAGLIKTALSLKHKTLPPSLHFTQPNPKIEFAGSPFYVNSKLTNWEAGATPRRAGVSAFGFGGTNAHVVLEEAPAPPCAPPSRGWQLLLLSAKTAPALEAATTNLLAHFKTQPNINLADAAFTLQVGRGAFAHRRMLLGRETADAVTALETFDAKRVITQQVANQVRPVAFMFPGQGSQYVNMGAELYRHEPTFKKEIDRCAQLLLPYLALDLREVLFPSADQEKAAEERLLQTRYAQPALFVFEFALSKLWESWGIVPACMIGHSVGEYVAACLAEVFTLEDALRIVAKRAELVQAQPRGAMLAVRLGADKIQPFVKDRLSLAAVNSPTLCVVSGPFEAIDELEARLQSQGVPARRLHTSHAFHSAMMDPVVEPLTALLRGITLHQPTKPFVSNVTGRWITDQEVTDPKYWASQLRQTVRFADGVGELLRNSEYVLLEVGPGQTLSPMARQQAGKASNETILSSFSASQGDETAALLEALGQLWLAGQTVDWWAFHRHEKRQRITLPTYPFERKRYWVEPRPPAAAASNLAAALAGTQTATRLDSETTRHSSSFAAPASEEMKSGAHVNILRTPTTLQAITDLFHQLSGANLTATETTVSFFELGFDSLLLAQASQLITNRFGVQVPFRQLLEDTTTLERLVRFLEKNQRANSVPQPETSVSFRASEMAGLTVTARPQSAPALAHQPTQPAELASVPPKPPAFTPVAAKAQPTLPAIQRTADLSPAERSVSGSPVTATEAATSEILPLNEAQMELWLAASSDPEASSAYNQILAIHVRSPLRLDTLSEVLQELVNRHDALRTTFLPDGSGQEIHASMRLQVARHDLAAESTAKAEASLAGAIAQEDSFVFDLTRGPLLRAQVFGMPEGRHVLLLNAHHIVLDGWSIGVLLRELSLLYIASVQKVPADVGLPLQYRDYLGWQQSPENRAAVAQAEAYWLRQFAPPPQPIELPADRPRPGRKTYRAENQQRVIASWLYRRLKQAAASQHCTFFTYLVASLNVWLHRLTGQSDLVVAFPSAGQINDGGQRSANSRSLVGHCANLLPLRSQCEDEKPFADYLREVGGLIVDAHDHQSYTFGSLVRKLKLPRDADRVPLIPVVFNLSNLPRNLRLPDSDVVFPAKHFNYFDLNLEATDSGEDLQINCRFNADLFDATTIQRWLGHWETLLEGMVAEPRRQIAALPVMTASERQQVLVDWNQTEMFYPKDRCLHELFERQAARTPAATALVFEAKRLTYQELNRQANQLAHYLQTAGVRPGALVAICVERSLEMVVGLLGILKAGGAYVPLDPDYPKDRLAFMLEDSEAMMLLTRRSLDKALPSFRNRTVRVDADGPEIGAQDTSNVSSGASPEQPAYVIYTSGSTGRPKGVTISHRSAVAFAHWAPTVFTRAELAGVLFSTSICFDLSIFELFVTLAHGGKVVLARNALELPTLKAAKEVTLINTVPSAMAELIRLHGVPASVITVNLAGEPLPQSLVEDLYHQGSIRKVYDLYGPTETTTYSTCALRQSGGMVTIGRPIANTLIYLLDRFRQPVPVGITGELYIGGAGLALGYHHRPELTAEKFVPDPFRTGPDARLYKTGDLARYLPDGNLQYVGRADGQVKIRGFRIELGEIESALREQPAVREVVVLAREDTPGDKRLVAYLIPKEALQPNAAELRQALKAKLPDYMVPAAFVTLERLPLTPNGKINRRALPKPEFASAKRDDAPPRTPTELALAKIWAEVLGLKQVSIDDNFFEIGGHSLLAIRLTGEIQRQFQFDLPVRAFFQHPTIRDLAAELARPRPLEKKPEFIQLHGATPGVQLVLLIDEGSLGLFKLSHFIKSDLALYASVVPLPEAALKASAEKRLAALPTMEELAAWHVAQIRSHQLPGPLVLAGHCFGGRLAFEVAHQLQRGGQKVEAVLMLDTWMAQPSSRWLRTAWLQAHLRRLWQQGLGYLWRKSRRRVHLERQELASQLKFKTNADFSMHVPWAIIERIYHQATIGHRLQVLASRGILLVSQDDWQSNAYRRLDDTLGTSQWFAEGVKVLNVPGDHVTVLDETRLGQLAQSFEHSLELLKSPLPAPVPTVPSRWAHSPTRPQR